MQPLTVIVAPPLEDMFPPPVAVVLVMLVTGNTVVSVGKPRGETVANDTCDP